MTRKEALQEAVLALGRYGKYHDVLSKLSEMLDEYPSPHWTQAKIIDAFEQWIKEHGRVPSLSVIDNSRELPSHTSITNAFKMTSRAFLDTYFPEAARTVHIGGRGPNTPEGWAQAFKDEFIRIQAVSATDYNARRAKGFPQYQTIVKLLGLRSWAELALNLDLPKYTPLSRRATRSKPQIEMQWTSPRKREYLRLKAERDEYAKLYPEVYGPR